MCCCFTVFICIHPILQVRCRCGLASIEQRARGHGGVGKTGVRSGKRWSPNLQGGRRTSYCQRDGPHMDIEALDPQDRRRVEIVVDGLPLVWRLQWTPLVSALHFDGSATAGARDNHGAAFVRARRRKERTHPELVGPRARAQLVEVAGRWSEETRTRNETTLMRRRIEQAWRMSGGQSSLVRLERLWCLCWCCAPLKVQME